MNAPPRREVAIFSTALELDPSRRAAYLDQACAGDSLLRRQVEALLGMHDEAIPFLEAPAFANTSGFSAALNANGVRSPAEKAGDRIGRYKLLQQIGEGGCGVVYMAEQQEPVRRRVALKVLKLGMDTRSVIARFEAERQALALMDHPNIAKVLDAGATESGRPYFVMELVRGVKLTDYCDQNELATQERLKLFTQVCQAVQHAHQKGIIHRDLKPSNILVSVSEPGAAGVPKVIDFGIAKATTGERLTDKTVFTAFEQFIGTPAYMSPEQAMMTELDIDTRTDIYSLGVLLYELLTGKTPFEQKELLAAGLDEMRRQLREREPVRPSTRLSTMLAAELTTTARHRRADPPKLIHLLRGDLDWIVMKCLEKDRARRYETANGLAMDVQRYLADEPVVARPPSRLYRLQKLARRNKLAFAAGATVVLALVAGLAVSNWFFFREKTARRRAVAAEHQAQTIIRFLTEDLLFQATPDQNAREKKVTMEEVLDQATRRLDQSATLARQPEVEAALRLAVGSTYYRLSRMHEAETNLWRAYNLLLENLGRGHLETLAAEHQLAEFLVWGPEEREKGAQLALEAWQGRRQLLGATSRDTLKSQELYCDALLDAGRAQQGIPIVRQLLQLRTQALGPDDHDTICSLGDLGQALAVSGAREEAAPYFQEALTRFQRTGYSDKREWFICLKELALSHLLMGNPTEADRLLTEAASRAARVFGAEALLTLQFQRTRARALAEADHLTAAEDLAKATLELKRRQATDPEGTARTLLYLGRVLVQENKTDEAEPYLKEALELFRQHSPQKLELPAQAQNWLGAILVTRQNFAEAERLLLASCEPLFAPAAEMSLNERRLAVGHLVTLYRAWGNPEQTTRWQRRLDALTPAVQVSARGQ